MVGVGRGIVWTAILGVLLVVLASGPLIPVDFTTEETTGSVFASDTTGTIEFTVLTAPSEATLEAGRYGTDTYVLRAPVVEIFVDSLDGQAVVGYQLHLPALRYARESVHVLREETHANQRVRLGFEPDTFPRAEITQDAYQAELGIAVRGVQNPGVRYAANVTVRVE